MRQTREAICVHGFTRASLCVLRPDSLYKGVNDVDGRHNRSDDEKGQGSVDINMRLCEEIAPAVRMWEINSVSLVAACAIRHSCWNRWDEGR